jgi:RimJ/RimL family protein N-acetyltransferase
VKIVLPAEPLADGPTALRPWRDSDVAAIVAACQDPEIPRWTMLPEPYGEADGREYLRSRYDMLHGGISAPLAIVDGADHDQLLGSISLLHFNWDHRRAEVGYWLAREARGHGHTTRAVRLICDWGFRTLGLERIGLRAAVENGASQRVAERAGFTREAVQRRYLRIKDRQMDMVAFGLLVGEARAS